MREEGTEGSYLRAYKVGHNHQTPVRAALLHDRFFGRKLQTPECMLNVLSTEDTSNETLAG